MCPYRFPLLMLLAPLIASAQPTSFPLKDAARAGDVATVVALLDAGAQIEDEDEGQNTALISASWHGRAEVVSELLKRGADATHRNGDGYAGFDYAMERKHREVVLTYLHYWLKSAQLANQEEEEKALEALVLVTQADPDATLPVKLDANASNASGYGPLAMASRWGARRHVEQLIALGAEPGAHSISRYNSTPLMEATRDGHLDIAQLLVAAGADVNERDRHGDHALNWAAFFGHTEMVRYLVEQGSRLDFTGQSPETALQIATREGHVETVEILKIAGAKSRQQ